MAAGSQSDFRPSSSCGSIEGADILPVKWTGNSLRPRCTAGFQWGTTRETWTVLEKCLPLYLQYLVPHSECSLQLAPKGFMLFQRHSSERLVLCSRPLRESSGSGSEATCGGNGRRVSSGESEGGWIRLPELILPERRRRASAAERPGWSFPEESSWCVHTSDGAEARGWYVDPRPLY